MWLSNINECAIPATFRFYYGFYDLDELFKLLHNCAQPRKFLRLGPFAKSCELSFTHIDNNKSTAEVSRVNKSVQR